MKIRLNLIHLHGMICVSARAVSLEQIHVYVPFIGKFCANAFGLHCVDYDKAFVIPYEGVSIGRSERIK